MHFMINVDCDSHSRRKHHSTSTGVYVLNQKDLVVGGSKDSILRPGVELLLDGCSCTPINFKSQYRRQVLSDVQSQRGSSYC